MSQADLAATVWETPVQQLRAGYTHRFIDIMFVRVGDRVFCRRYQYREPSWHSAFLNDPEGQLRVGDTILNIEGRVPADFDDIIPQIDQAYVGSLTRLGSEHLIPGAVEERAQKSTLEIIVVGEASG